MKLRLTAVLALIVAILCGCHPTPAPRPTYVPTSYPGSVGVLADYAYPLICFEPPVIDQFEFGRGGGIRYTTNTTNGCGTAWGVIGEEYTIWAEAEGYEPVTYPFTMSHAKEVIHVSSLGTPTTPPTPTETTRPTKTISPIPTDTQTSVPTVPIATATPWASLPARYAVAIAREAQERLGIDWHTDRDIWLSMSGGGDSESKAAPLNYVMQIEIDSETFCWTVGTNAIVYIYARGCVYEESLWAYIPTPVPTATQTLKPTSTRTIAPTRTYTPRPTVPPATATITPTPGPNQTPLPIIYKMFDYGTDYQTTYPEYGPIGSDQWIDTCRTNPSPGIYNWDAMEANLAKEDGLMVTLWDGSEVAKPVVFAGVIGYTSDIPGEDGHDFIYWGAPHWPAPYVMTYLDRTAVIPPYDNAQWREIQYDIARAFGARYNNDDRVKAVVIPTGIDGESQATKDAGAYAWKTKAMNEQYPGLEKTFEEFVLELMGVYREALPSKTIFINNAPKELREVTANAAATYDPPIGLKHSGMVVDLDSHQGYGTFWPGSWDMERVYSRTLPIWVESPTGLGNEEKRYWAYLAGLHYWPDVISVHPEYLTIESEWTRWVGQHIGVSIEDTPSIWAVLRDREFEKQSWGTGGVSGYMGNWTQGLQTEGPAERVWRDELPRGGGGVYGRQCRDIIEEQTFQAEAPFVVRRVEVTVFPVGQTVTVIAGGEAFGQEVGSTGDWVTLGFDVPDCTEFSVIGSRYTHKVEAFREPSVTPKEKKTWTMMIYMAGDNNLAYYFGRAIGYLEMLLPLNNTHVILFVDGPYEALAYYVEPQSDGPYTDLVNSWDLGEVNTGETATLRDFVVWATARYPSEYTYLAVSDHGRGTHGIAYDDTSYKDNLSPSELRAALTGQHIDVLHADACLMAMLENGYQVRDVADYYVAYENLGWSVFAYDEYAKIADTGVTPRELAIGIADAYHAHEKLKGDPRTSSAVDLSKIGPVMDRLNDLVDVLRKTDRAMVLAGRKWAQRFDTLDYFYLTPADEYIDLGDFALELLRKAEDESLKTACQALIAAIDDYVLVSHAVGGMMYGPGYSAYVELRDAKGVAIYFPQTSSALEFDEYVGGTLFTFTEASQWDDFLAEFYFSSVEGSRLVVIEDREPPPMLETE